jgi:hypothetical protein
MRSRNTNVLQAVVLIAGILYLAAGLVFFVSPTLFAGIFGIKVQEDWFNQIKFDSFVAPLFFIARAFAATVFALGASMVLPLFDPLRYRGLMYFSGVMFPFMAGLLLLVNGIWFEHLVLKVFGGIILLVGSGFIFGLVITRKMAQAGEE